MQKIRTLCDLHIEESGIVGRVDCSGCELRRLLDLGLTEGTEVSALFVSPFGDPTAYFIRGTVIALRRRDAQKIILKDEE